MKLQSGLTKIAPDQHDYSLLHSYGALTSDPKSLPTSFSIYDGRPIPNQNNFDDRFTPPLPPLPMGCTGEAGAFESGLQDGKLYNPKPLYEHTPPGGNGGRDMREMLSTLINHGPQEADETFGPRRTAYFNCYGSGKISDFDAARFGLWINQNEKRGVYVGSYWYPEFENLDMSAALPIPSFNIRDASLHCHLATGWDTTYKGVYLEDLSWQGEGYGKGGIDYISPEIYNALMGQPWTGAFTITKTEGVSPLPIGAQAWIDHLIYYFRSIL